MRAYHLLVEEHEALQIAHGLGGRRHVLEHDPRLAAQPERAADVDLENRTKLREQGVEALLELCARSVSQWRQQRQRLVREHAPSRLTRSLRLLRYSVWFGVTSGTSGALVLVLEFSSAEAVVSAVSAAASSAVAAAAAGSAMCESVCGLCGG